jgi:DNA-binding NarL/FixJ family response regulator
LKCQSETYYELVGCRPDSIFLNQWIHSTLVTHKFKIEVRRRKVAALLAQSMNETEVAYELKVDQSTISRSIKVLKGILE